ncbi:MAG TPA: hypothetical protein VH684_07875 [Xanthobacteraceae bacterium]
MFVDYAGQTVELYDGRTGEIIAAQTFVAVMGASSYTYAEASGTQTGGEGGERGGEPSAPGAAASMIALRHGLHRNQLLRMATGAAVASGRRRRRTPNRGLTQPHLSGSGIYNRI